VRGDGFRDFEQDLIRSQRRDGGLWRSGSIHQRRIAS
jgi:hypothetical protein